MLTLLKKRSSTWIIESTSLWGSQASFYYDKYLQLKASETDAQVSKDYGPRDKIIKI